MMDSAGAGEDAPAGLPVVWARSSAAVSRRFQHFLDKATPYVGRRWAWLGALAAAYFLRVFLIQGFYIVTYCLGVYIVYLLVDFLSPLEDPEIQELLDSLGPSLPTKSSDEFRPLVRSLPELKFWYSITKAFCIAFAMTFFRVFDVPVFWPILLLHWMVLFTVLMKRQIGHMIKYKYVPFTLRSKKRYVGKKAATTNEATPPVKLEDNIL